MPFFLISFNFRFKIQSLAFECAVVRAEINSTRYSAPTSGVIKVFRSSAWAAHFPFAFDALF